MQTRIKYNFDETGVLGESRQIFKVNGREVKVYLLMDNLKYQIRDNSTGDVLKEGGNTKNRAVLLKQAKKGLSDLGFNFGEEKRNRGNNEAKVGEDQS